MEPRAGRPSPNTRHHVTTVIGRLTSMPQIPETTPFPRQKSIACGSLVATAASCVEGKKKSYLFARSLSLS